MYLRNTVICNSFRDGKVNKPALFKFHPPDSCSISLAIMIRPDDFKLPRASRPLHASLGHQSAGEKSRRSHW